MSENERDFFNLFLHSLYFAKRSNCPVNKIWIKNWLSFCLLMFSPQKTKNMLAKIVQHWAKLAMRAMQKLRACTHASVRGSNRSFLDWNLDLKGVCHSSWTNRSQVVYSKTCFPIEIGNLKSRAQTAVWGGHPFLSRHAVKWWMNERKIWMTLIFFQVMVMENRSNSLASIDDYWIIATDHSTYQIKK